jgi:hypothetical protein
MSVGVGDGLHGQQSKRHGIVQGHGMRARLTRKIYTCLIPVCETELGAEFGHQSAGIDFAVGVVVILFIEQAVDKSQCPHPHARLFNRPARDRIVNLPGLQIEQAGNDLEVVLYAMMHLMGQRPVGAIPFGHCLREGIQVFA